MKNNTDMCNYKEAVKFVTVSLDKNPHPWAWFNTGSDEPVFE
jgi:hypothetical protein